MRVGLSVWPVKRISTIGGSRREQSVVEAIARLQKRETVLSDLRLRFDVNIPVLPIGKVRVVQIGSKISEHGLLKLCVVQTYPLSITSSSTPYILGCHVPHPSLNLGGTNLAIRPFSFGLRNKDTCILSGKSCSRGKRIRAVESGPGRVERLRSRCSRTCTVGVSCSDLYSASTCFTLSVNITTYCERQTHQLPFLRPNIQ